MDDDAVEMEAGMEDSPFPVWKESGDRVSRLPDAGGGDDDDVVVQQPSATISASAAASGWTDRLCIETLAGLGSPPPPSEGSLRSPSAAVEELTLNNYRNPSLQANGGSSFGVPPTKGMWMDFRRTLTRPIGSSERVGIEEGAGSIILQHGKRNSAEIDETGALPVGGGSGTSSSPASGFRFAHFFSRNASMGNSTSDAVGIAMAVDPSRKSADVVAEPPVLGGAGGVSDVQGDGVNMRDWLDSGGRLSKGEALHVFMQIVEFVDASHSQGNALQHLRPSFFVIRPLTNQVKYVGALIPRAGVEQSGALMVNYSKRKEYPESDDGSCDASSKRLRNGEKNAAFSEMFETGGGARGDFVREGGAVTFDMAEHDLEWRHRSKFGELYGRQSPCKTNFSINQRQPVSEIAKMEETWYASPEQFQDSSSWLFTSNVYSLGVLLFELSCHFESWESHSFAMVDLRHRILPPKFLQLNPKEAGFCLWLLHPEPYLRPKSRDILFCDLISEARHLSYPNEATISIEKEDAESELLFNFLLDLKEHMEKQTVKLTVDIEMLTADIEEVEKRRPLTGLADTLENVSRLPAEAVNEERLMKVIDQLKNAYFSFRKVDPSDSTVATRSDGDVLNTNGRSVQSDGHMWHPCNESIDHHGAFFEGLCKYARYTKFKVRGTLSNGGILNSLNVISSVCCDRDEDFFATAGVSKKIKIFEFQGLLNDVVDVHYPVVEMSSNSKLSCVCWNSYIRNYLASSDYDGVVQLWDASTGRRLTQFVEHLKRAWSVDFCHTDPTKLASGGDDCSVKLWTINEGNCIETIRSRANVCSVQFSPHSSHLLSFSSADYNVYCYDLRHTRVPWCTLAGHVKAVSHVKFVNAETVVSASTDSTVKIWALKKANSTGPSPDACSMTLTGHTNKRNFIGLTQSDGYIACGSETNEVYAYYRAFPMPITSQNLGSVDPITGQEAGDGPGHFVSSVCWREKSGTILAASSNGSIKLLQLV